ncbi:CPBP family intramembrane metalloprotease [Glutamicibacter halophytocola]|uniref:CPBP family intramembrane metalloprotease n=1 Tax=Glutamicibacter halophytocola TaxID=1933880 RepID=A0ABX5YES4_9MICC|nr:CPBP family intramembrane glutamic endopeptidase [Glutamicibacter halophytocola]MBF6671225.1 CPBP family intramembrane metalloprotease [Glutamicibacter sp. FBE19]NQD41182.1 CPBP family intramembrane metalloprotease [Glutamicibacter halophytocola]QDY68144.1 CPBP family intramembrane metalloprotease [Glutamicibacter halophytocola]
MENVNAKILKFEIALVLALSLGQSAIYSILSFADKATRAPLREQTTSLNNPLSTREFFDFSYQLLDIVFALVPVLLALYLMKRSTGRGVREIGFDLRAPGKDSLMGAGLFLAMGLGTLGVYAAGRALGITTAISAANLGDYWWSVPVLLLSAVRHAVLEEVLMLGFLFSYARKLRLGLWTTIISSAVIRGSYHLYQGAGPMIGNMLMGVVFGWAYHKYGRVMPLVIAHFMLDAIGFVGYALIGPAIGIGN